MFVPPDALSPVFDALERAGVMLRRDEASRDARRIALFTGRLGTIVVDVFVSEHPHYSAMRDRRANVDGLWVLSVEDLCTHKLLFARPRDIDDLERLFAVRGRIDVDYVRDWLRQIVPSDDRRHAVLDELERRFLSHE